MTDLLEAEDPPHLGHDVVRGPAAVLVHQEERRVGNDNTVHWRGRRLQIPPTPLRAHLVRAKVRIHDYPDGTVAVFKGPQRLVTFAPEPGSEAEQDLAA